MKPQREDARKTRYVEALRNLPPSGGGGAHAGILRVANLGRIAGLARERIESDIATFWHGERRPRRTEISEATAKAFNSRSISEFSPAPRPRVDGKKLLDAILRRGSGATEVDLEKASPVELPREPKRHAMETLRLLYREHDRLFIGERYDAGPQHILPTPEWIRRFDRGATVPPHIIPNPLSGEQGFTKDGEPSFRADLCVARFRFVTIEHDQMPRQQQIEFWAGAPLPVVALIDSGGKSIHGWVRIDAQDSEEWTRRVEDDLFSYLRAVGVDGTSRNEARLSRMPGHFRSEKSRWQRALYLNPEGGQVR